ncbi:5-formyltetrahydrofolate cyclo-ligase [Marinilabilia salmonicolor]|jgi:5,10-methenyltetrahydrofolate synthetase|uniref:5,10-methenyltetrahydrofolate synthetase n=1 Tax=Marinilabilia salmonicolor TaxID=989 RepID=A0A368V8H9_9BACT|nr:5-formyltetrahydrofolate cyclo-ligase [Marinilabilia salmonicolor]RCW36620.1 5,10-methenyltetrahydrofolate synthetase [Marinilabilia salmonicolor]
MEKKSSVEIGILQFAPVPGDIEANIKKIDGLLESNPHSDIMVLPELASSGYNFKSREEAINSSEPINESRYVDFLIQKARALNTWFVSGINEREDDKLFNSAVLVSPNGVEGIYRKMHLFNREKIFFEPGNSGLPIFETPFGIVGILICFDWMFPELWRVLALKGAQIICHPSNLVLPFCQSAIPGYALTNRIFVATANRVGKERDLTFTGQSVLVNPNGEYLLRGDHQNEEILSADIEPELAEDKQMTPLNDAFEDRRTDFYTVDTREDHATMKREKKILRRKIQKRKQQYNEDQLKTIGQDAMAQLEKTSEFKAAKTIFIYWSLPDEVPTHELIEKYRKEKRFILPRVVGDYLELREFTGIESLEQGNSFGIQEPTGIIFSDLSSIDLVVVPGLAFTRNGHRLGRGGGYYDRTLPYLENAAKIGVAFPFQMVARVPFDTHDIPLDKVIAANKDH